MTSTRQDEIEGMLQGVDNLPSLPAVALEVLRLCRGDTTTLDDLARTLSLDPALSARLLRFANSSLYGTGGEVRTLQRATLVLGMKTVQLMSLSFSLVAALPREGSTGAFDYGHYWRRSLVRATAARALAGRIGLAIQDEAFLAGLLGEIGQVVLARCLADLYAPVLADNQRCGNDWPCPELEREHLGFDHREVGATLLRLWQLPTLLGEAVRFAGAPEDLPGDAPAALVELVRVLSLAQLVPDSPGRKGTAGAMAELQTRAQAWFELESEDLARLLAELQTPLRETASLLELSWPPGQSPEHTLDQARDELLRLSLGQQRELSSLRVAVDPVHRARLLADPAHTDALTGGASEAGFRVVLEHEVRVRLDGNLSRPIGLFGIEIDGFAAMDSEEARTESQRALAGCLVRLVRKNDLIARLAPGAFAVLLNDANPFGLVAMAERVREEVAHVRLVLASGELTFGISLGGACMAKLRDAGSGAALRAVVARLLAKARAQGGGLEVHNRWVVDP